LDGPGIESRWGARFSAPVQTGPEAHPASYTIGTGSFPGVKSGRGVTLTPYPFKCRGQERVELYLYSPYVPYGLYRASVPVDGCTFYILYSFHVRTVACTLTAQIEIRFHTTDRSEEDQRDRARSLKRHSAEHPERKQVGMA